MQPEMRGKLWSALAAVALLLAACGPAATPAPVATATPTTPTPAAVQAGATPRPSPTSPPTPIPQTSPTPPSGAKSGGNFVMVNDVREPTGWDGWAMKGGARDIRVRHNLVFSLLFSFPGTPETKCQLVLTPELAESWKWLRDDLLQVKVRQGVKFHNKPPVNGRELTAEDVAWSANQFILQNTIRGLEAIRARVTKIEATDRYTVEFRTDGPLPILINTGLASMYGAVILPKEAVATGGTWSDPNKSWVGSGPFMFDKHVPGVATVFAKNRDYFKKGLPYLDTVKYMVMPDLSTQLAGLRSGALDMVYGPIPAPMAMPLRDVRALKVTSCPQLSNVPGRLYFHTNEPPFNDVRVRRALSLALDRQGMVDAILQGQGVTAPLNPREVTNHHVGWDELPPEVAQWLKYDPKRAKQLLTEAGYPNGFAISFKLNTAYGSPYREVGEALVSALEAIGIKVKPHWATAPEFAAFSDTGDFKGDNMAMGLAVPDRLLEIAGAWHSQSAVSINRSRIRDPEVDRLMDRFLVELDEKQAQQIYKQLEIRVIDQGWEITPGTFPLGFTATRDYVRDWAGGHQFYASTYLERIWLDR